MKRIVASMGQIAASRLVGFSLLLLLIASACEPAATPIPVVVQPSPTPIPQATAIPQIRYALTQNTQGWVPDLVLLEAAASVQQLSNDGMAGVLQDGYDIIVTYGFVDGWQESPRMMRAALLINTSLPPLDDDFIREQLIASVQAADFLANSAANSDTNSAANSAANSESAIPDILLADGMTGDSGISTQIRSALANYGYPDGFSLRLIGDNIPLEAALFTQLRASGFAVVRGSIRAPAESAHVIIGFAGADDVWADWRETYGAANILPLFDVPISYLVRDELAIDFTPNGFPIPDTAPDAGSS